MISFVRKLFDNAYSVWYYTNRKGKPDTAAYPLIKDMPFIINSSRSLLGVVGGYFFLPKIV